MSAVTSAASSAMTGMAFARIFDRILIMGKPLYAEK